MLQKLWKIIKSILFLGVLGVAIYGVTLAILPKIPDFYQEDEWDVVFFGSSQAYCTFDPEIFDEYGLKTYNRGRQQQTLNYTYYYVKDAFDVADIDIVVLETFAFNYDEGDDRFHNSGIRESTLGDMRYSQIKVDAILDCVEEDLQFEYLNPLDKYHSNWEKWDFSSWERIQETVFSPYYEENSDRGFFGWTGKTAFGYPSWTQLHGGEHLDVYSENLRYLEMIYELCEENDAQLILVRGPLPSYEKVIGQTNTVMDWAAERNIPFINFMLLTEIIGLDFTSDSIDEGVHLNDNGAAKVSRYLAQYIMEHYYTEE